MQTLALQGFFFVVFRLILSVFLNVLSVFLRIWLQIDAFLVLLETQPCKNLRKMATVKLYIDTRTPQKDGTCPIKIAAHHKGDIMIATGVSVLSNQWIGAAEQPTDNKPMTLLKNLSN